MRTEDTAAQFGGCQNKHAAEGIYLPPTMSKEEVNIGTWSSCPQRVFQIISVFGKNRTGFRKPASAINRVYSLVKWGPGNLPQKKIIKIKLEKVWV